MSYQLTTQVNLTFLLNLTRLLKSIIICSAPFLLDSIYITHIRILACIRICVMLTLVLTTICTFYRRRD